MRWCKSQEAKSNSRSYILGNILSLPGGLQEHRNTDISVFKAWKVYLLMWVKIFVSCHWSQWKDSCCLQCEITCVLSVNILSVFLKMLTRDIPVSTFKLIILKLSFDFFRSFYWSQNIFNVYNVVPPYSEFFFLKCKHSNVNFLLLMHTL